MIYDFKSLLKSFKHAFKGISTCLKTERNFRIHITAMFYVIAVSFLAEISSTEYILLIICFSQMMSSELLNTAVEILCDKESNGYNIYIKSAKDIAAAAVLVCAIGCVFIGFIIFLPKIHIIFSNLKLIYAIIILLSIPFSTLFIFKQN